MTISASGISFRTLTFLFLLVSMGTACLSGQTDPDHPNVLLIIADDLGVDAFNGYQDNALKPVTPHLDSLRAAGVAFRNFWTAPQCTPTRACVMSGKYGNKSGVQAVPGNLDTLHESLFEAIKNTSGNQYSQAVIGKWHISDPVDLDHPAQLGVDYYEGVFGSGVNPSYLDWEKTLGGLDQPTNIQPETEYATSYLTNSAVDWIRKQTQPWFMWLAHVSPHAPYHIPPDTSTYSQAPLNTNLQRYMAMIENLDYEIGRLLDSIPDEVLANTTILFMGDHGAGNGVTQNFPNGHNKGTLYQGSVHAPLFACGHKVTRQNVWEESLVNATDIYATILELTGHDLDGGIYNSLSFLPQLQSGGAVRRVYNYTEIKGDTITVTGHTIRNEQYKLIAFDDGREELYDLWTDSLELQDVIGQADLSDVLYDLRREAHQIQTDWSCQDRIQNGSESGVDCGTARCGQCADVSTIYPCEHDVLQVCAEIAVDTFIVAESQINSAHSMYAQNALMQASDCVVLEPGFSFAGGQLEISMEGCDREGIEDADCVSSNALSHAPIGCSLAPTSASIYSEVIAGDYRVITTNNYPNHYHDAKNNASIPQPKDYTFQVARNPVIHPQISSIVNAGNRPRRFFGVALNGVLMAPAPATPFIFTNVNTGEYNYDWVFEPTNNIGSGSDWVSLDCASAHTGPQGYHYHGNMVSYVETIAAGISTTQTAPAEVVHLGWAADGYPVLYRFGPDAEGNLALLQPSYQLKYGLRPGDGLNAPCGSYNGKYTNDYEYIGCLGDLDQCNGIQREVTINTIEGPKTFDYFYVVTDNFPQIGRCLRGLPDPSFD